MEGTARFGVLKYSATHFLIALALLLLAVPFAEPFEFAKLVETTLLTLVLLSAVLAVGGRRSTLVTAIFLVIPALGSTWMEHTYPGNAPSWLFPPTTLLFMVFVIFHLFRFVLRAPRVQTQVLAAAIANYLMLGLAWAFAYTLLARLSLGAFIFDPALPAGPSMSGSTALYYSFGTITTIGAGDIVPALTSARALTVAQATVGTLYVAVLIARLVGLVSAKQPD